MHIHCWSLNYVPLSVAVECGHPPDVVNAQHSLSFNRTSGTTLQYHCLHGNMIRYSVTSQLIRCEDDGRWTDPMPCVGKITLINVPTYLDYFHMLGLAKY